MNALDQLEQLAAELSGDRELVIAREPDGRLSIRRDVSECDDGCYEVWGRGNTVAEAIAELLAKTDDDAEFFSYSDEFDAADESLADDQEGDSDDLPQEQPAPFRPKFGIKSLMLLMLFAACGMMMIRNAYVENQYLPRPKFDNGAGTTMFSDKKWLDVYALVKGDESRPVLVKERDLNGGLPGKPYYWAYEVENPDGTEESIIEDYLEPAENAKELFFKAEVEDRQSRLEEFRKSLQEKFEGTSSRISNSTFINTLDRFPEPPAVSVGPYATPPENPAKFRIEEKFFLEGMRIEPNRPPRRLIRVRTEQPSITVCGHTLRDLYINTWVDVDNGEDVDAPGLHDLIMGTVEIARETPSAPRSASLSIEGQNATTRISNNVFDNSTDKLLQWFIDAGAECYDDEPEEPETFIEYP